MSTQTKEITFQGSEETRLRSLARELAMDILPRDDVLKHHGVDHEEWSRIAALPVFAKMYQDAVATWQSAMNTRERIEAKTLTLLEMSLEEMFARLHDKTELLSSKVALFQALQKGAGIGARNDNTLDTAGRVSITINMGEGQKVTVDQEVTPRVIDGEVIPQDE